MGQYRPDYEVGLIADSGRNAGETRYSDINRSPREDELEAAYETARSAGLWRFDRQKPLRR